MLKQMLSDDRNEAVREAVTKSLALVVAFIENVDKYEQVILLKWYFPLAKERNKWKMFCHTPLGPGPEGLFFESRAQCCLSFELIAYTLLVRSSLLRLSA